MTTSSASFDRSALRFRRLLTTHPGVVVDSAALLSARARPANETPPLFHLLLAAAESGRPVMLHTEHPGEEDDLLRRGVPRLWTLTAAPGPLAEISALPLVKAISLGRANELPVPLPALWPTVYGQMVGAPQHPVQVQPSITAMINLSMAGRTGEEIAGAVGANGKLITSALSLTASRRGCVNSTHLIARDIVDGYLDPAAALRSATAPPGTLSQPQFDALAASIDTGSLNVLAARLGCSRRVAQTHRSGAVKALGALTPTQAAAIALATGALPDQAVPARTPYPPDLRRHRHPPAATEATAARGEEAGRPR
ncbi:hypothetical protein [Kitasatospora sp. NPDC088783]|uniref:hypothetical protein n=1 Tax=Kitasatospora sp. NPDC088783 TaxID=3364077 RepID=UPI00382754EA